MFCFAAAAGKLWASRLSAAASGAAETHLLVRPQRQVQVEEVTAAPPLVALRIAGVVAWAGVHDLDLQIND